MHPDNGSPHWLPVGLFDWRRTPRTMAKDRSQTYKPCKLVEAIGRMRTMSNLVCRIAALVLFMAGARNVSAVGQPALAATGAWGFDLSGADFATKPGDD